MVLIELKAFVFHCLCGNVLVFLFRLQSTHTHTHTKTKISYEPKPYGKPRNNNNAGCFRRKFFSIAFVGLRLAPIVRYDCVRALCILLKLVDSDRQSQVHNFKPAFKHKRKLIYCKQYTSNTFAPRCLFRIYFNKSQISASFPLRSYRQIPKTYDNNHNTKHQLNDIWTYVSSVSRFDTYSTCPHKK